MAEQLSLAQAFQNRPGRFRLLKKGIERTGWKSSSVRLLEAGCSVGDAAAMLSVEMGFDVTAFDHEPALVVKRFAFTEQAAGFILMRQTRRPCHIRRHPLKVCTARRHFHR